LGHLQYVLGYTAEANYSTPFFWAGLKEIYIPVYAQN